MIFLDYCVDIEIFRLLLDNETRCHNLVNYLRQLKFFIQKLPKRIAMTLPIEKKFIDIDKVINDKNPKLLQVMPGFLLRYVKKILHQEEINGFINRNGHHLSFDFVDDIIREFGATVNIYGIENLPLTGGCIIAINHPLGGLDGIALVQSIGKKRRDLKFIVNDVLLQVKNLEDIFIGVNKHGKNAAQSLVIINNLYKTDIALMIFPAGLASRKQSGVIKDLEWKKTFITRARQHKKDVIPVFIDGHNTNFFYNFARWRKRLGVKTNIEMFYLVDEMYKQKGQTINITFGKPIPHTLFDKRFTDFEWAQKVKDFVYILKGNGAKEFQP